MNREVEQARRGVRDAGVEDASAGDSSGTDATIEDASVGDAGAGDAGGEGGAASPITQLTIPTANSNPVGITAGPDGNVWFTEQDANKIGKLTL